jgi:histidinol-phosphatase (PHP family)
MRKRFPGIVCMIPQDYHIHSLYSADSQTSMDAMCRRAVALGILEIGFADHYDLHPDEEPRDWLRIEPWIQDLRNCRAAFRNSLVIRAGIEIGEPHRFQAETRAMLARAPFDYVIGSLHWVDRNAVFKPAYFNRPAEEAFRDYFLELERMTRTGGFDILGHLDVPARGSFEYYGTYQPQMYEAWIRPVLRNCIERGIALDVNTSGLRRRAKILLPGLDVLCWYAEMGGTRVTLGSDAHRVDQMALNFEVALKTIQAAGLRHLTRFVLRRAYPVPLA